MKIAVTGVGYVGLVVAACFADGGHDVVCVDRDTGKIETLKKGIIPFYEPGLGEIVKRNVTAGRLVFTTELKTGVDNSDVIYIGVGTPSADDGSADLSAVFSVAGDIGRLMKTPKIIVMKSTVPVGTYAKVSEIISSVTDVPFEYVSNPEFLKEGTAVSDFLKPDRVVVGTDDRKTRETMQHIYAPFMRKANRILFMDTASAEMTKYASNVMLATRISFVNELSELCELYGADIDAVRRGMGSDSRIGKAFLFAGVGYGGSCFPKDVNALIKMGEQVNKDMSIARSVHNANIHQQERFARRVIDYYADNPGVRLGAWGLAFKARTDDTRQSPAVRCIKMFLDAGIEVAAYDPQAEPGELEGRITVAERAYDVLEGADGLVVFTDWQEFRNPDFERIAERLSRRVIFDGRNLYEPEYVAGYGIEYHSIGRRTPDVV